ncbi:MAG: protein YgfX [Sulfurifustis sp.]
MSEKSLDRLDVDLGASRALAVVLMAVHGGAMAIALALPLPIWVRLMLASATVASLYRGMLRHAFRRSSAAVVGFRINGANDQCALRRRGAGDWEEGRLIDRWVHPWLTLAVVSGARRWPEQIVIPADAVPAEALRRLRVRLRLPTAKE